jgi:hypothetical protein
VILELAPGTEPITGSVLSSGQPPRHFAGYVDLIAALEELGTEREQHITELPEAPPAEQPRTR